MNPLGKYAFEFIVIFIGITSSFLFDEWRDSLKENEKERQYFEVLAHDLQVGSLQLSAILNLTKYGKQKVDSVLKKSELRYEDLDLFSNHICTAFAYKEELVLLQSFESIKFSGDLGLIKNKEILEKCNNILSQQRALNKMIDRELSVWDEYYAYLDSEYIKLASSCAKFYAKAPKTDINSDDMEKFFSDRKTINFFSTLSFWNKQLYTRSKKLLKDRTALKTMLATELAKK